MTAFLQCDAKGCDHREDVHSIEEGMIGKPCPKCGANLLTEADYQASLPMFAVLDLLKSLGLASDPTPDASGELLVSMHHHDGKTTITSEERKQ